MLDNDTMYETDGDVGDFLDRYESGRETKVAEEDGRVAGRSGSVGRTSRAERPPVGRVPGRGDPLRAQGKYTAVIHNRTGGVGDYTYCIS